MPDHASQLYARNIQSLLGRDGGEEGELKLDFEDEVIAGACITRDGEIVHEGAKQAAGRRRDGPAHRADDPRAGRLRGLRGDLEGAEHAAHAADVGHQRHPRHRAAGRPAADRRGHRLPRRAAARDRDRLRHDQRGRRLPRDRPDARDVQRKPKPEPAPRATPELEAVAPRRPRDPARQLPPGPGLHPGRSTSSRSSASSSACAAQPPAHGASAATRSRRWAWPSPWWPRC